MWARAWRPAIAIATATAAIAALPSAASAADLDCADFSNQAEAQEHLYPGDPHRLDGDNDGIACEDLPCPCSTGSAPPAGDDGSADGGSRRKPPPPPKLNKAAARSAAKRVARRYVRRNQRVQSAKLRGCGRRSRHRVACSFAVRGRRGSRATSCTLRVVVRGEGREARARIASARCRSRTVLRLGSARAKRAMQAEADRIAGRPATLFAFERLSAVAYTALAEWPRTRDAQAEICSMELVAELRPSRSLRVSTRDFACVATPAE